MIYSLVNLKSYSINYLNLSGKIGVEEKNNQNLKKFMKSFYKKIIFFISVIALVFVIVGVFKYSLTYIENNPEKYPPKKTKKKN